MESKVMEKIAAPNSIGIRCQGCGALLLTFSKEELKLIEEIRKLGWGQVKIIEVREGQPRLLRLELQKIIKLD